jgi:hypothetical protein
LRNHVGALVAHDRVAREKRGCGGFFVAHFVMVGQKIL